MIYERFKYRWAILAFMIVLLIFLGLIDIAVISGFEKSLLQNSRQQARKQLALMGTFVREALLRNDYITAKEFLSQWAEEHEDVVRFQAIAPNGFVLVEYKQKETENHRQVIDYSVEYNGRPLIDLKMDKDFTPVIKSLDSLKWQLSVRAVLLTIFMGVALWFVLRTLALTPLEREITRRRQAEEKFRNLLEGAPDAMALVDGNGILSLVNAQMENLFGYSRPELVGSNLEMLIPERYREKHRQYLEAYFQDRRIRSKGVSPEIHGLTKDNREFPVDISLNPLQTEEGMFVLIDVRDISDRKQMETALQKSEEQYRELVEGTDNLITQVNENGEITFVNPQAEKIYGLKPEQCRGRSAFDFVHPQDREKTRQAFNDWIVQKRPSVTFENRQISLTGEVHHLLWTINLHFDWKGDLQAINSIARDITERKKAEEKIKRNYQFQISINEILKTSLEPLTLEDQLGRILDLILEVPSLALESQGCIYLIDESDNTLIMKVQRGLDEETIRECSRVPVGECMCGKAASDSEVVFGSCLTEIHEFRRDGMIPHGHYCIPISSGDKIYGIINLVLQDGHERNEEEERFLSSTANTLAGVIERHQTSLEKEKLQDQLIESEKLTALGRMTANVAHEIRNPVTAVGGLAKRLDRNLSATSTEKKYTQTIVVEAQRLENILKRVDSFILDLPLVKEESDLNQLIKEVLAEFTEMFQRQAIEIQTSYTELALINLDRKKVKEVFENIFVNAVDTMKNGGKLSILTREDKGRQEKMFVVADITDTGEGVSEENQSLIFEPFYTTKSVGKRHAVGLGLSISKKFMNQHGGFIRVESEKGKGTTFSLFFPL